MANAENASSAWGRKARFTGHLRGCVGGVEFATLLFDAVSLSTDSLGLCNEGVKEGAGSCDSEDLFGPSQCP